MIEERQTTSERSSVCHPLEPLSAEEMREVVELMRGDPRFQALGPRARFASIALHEPAKSDVLGYAAGVPVAREALLILLNRTDNRAYEAVVSLTTRSVASWRHVQDVHPAILLEEQVEAEALIKADPSFQAALRKRGVEDAEQVVVDVWCVGNFGRPEEQQRRLAKGNPFVRTSYADNFFAHPIDGLTAVVDLAMMTVLAIEDLGVVPVPGGDGNYTPEAVGTLREDIKPLEIIQREGPSFTLDGHEVRWQKWRFRIGFTAREGVVVHTVGFEDGGRLRSIIYRAALSEMVVPYGDPSTAHHFRNAFDVGEIGVGINANSLELGCDCLGEIRYLDAVMADSDGSVLVRKNAICLHEEDFGLLWKHYDWRTDTTEVRRARRLVVQFIATLSNYEYAFNWYFYQDGSIEYEVKLTGILLTGGAAPGETPRYGTIVAPGVQALVHQHFFNMRLDMDVDGQQNAVYEVHTEAPPPGPENPFGNAFVPVRTLLGRESEAQQLVDPLRARSWDIVNPHLRNGLGQPVGYRLAPGENALPFAAADSSVVRRAGFMTRHLWVTPYQAEERYAAGDYPNQHAGGAGLPAYTRDDRPIADTDLVVWYTFGHHHIPRPEEWPIMSVARIGFMLKPVGFFDRNPALDVPPPSPHCHS